MSGVNRCRSSRRHHAVITCPLALGSQSPLSDPYKRMEPVNRAGDGCRELRARVVTRYVSELVSQNDPAVVFLPLERFFRKHYHRLGRTPGERRRYIGMTKQLDFPVDSSPQCLLADNPIPAYSIQRPRAFSQAAQTKMSEGEPCENGERSKHPAQNQE